MPSKMQIVIIVSKIILKGLTVLNLTEVFGENGRMNTASKDSAACQGVLGLICSIVWPSSAILFIAISLSRVSVFFMRNIARDTTMRKTINKPHPIATSIVPSFTCSAV
jgi:hypothetical protein